MQGRKLLLINLITINNTNELFIFDPLI